MSQFPEVASKLGTFMAQTLESFQNQIGDSEVEVGATMIITEVRFSPDTKGERGKTGLLVHCSDERVWVQIGLATTVLEDIKHPE